MKPATPPSAPASVNRREWLGTAGSVGALALNWLLNQDTAVAAASEATPYAAKPTHFAPRAKRVIHVCAFGGVSHLDTFDYKPVLAARHGEEYKDEKYDPFFGQPGTLFKSPYTFARHGQSGLYVSSL